MNLSSTTELFNKLLSQTDEKSEKGIYNNFIQILSSIKKKDLSEKQLQLIEEQLSALNLKTNTENKRKYYRQRLSEFKTFLKKEFSFTAKNHYRNKGIAIGMSIGIAIGAATTINIAVGMSVSMMFGLAIGQSKDTDAKEEGRVI
jgi:hypothetical protein